MRKSLRIVSNKGCDDCPSKCCHDLNMWISSPKNNEDIEDLLWELQFDTVRIYIRNKRWYMLIKGKCMYLDKNLMCTIYDKRPQKCRDHNPPDCEHYGEFWDVMFETPDDLRKYIAKRKRNAARRRNAKMKKKAAVA